MPKQVKKSVKRAPVMKEPTGFSDGPMVPENSVVEVDSKGVAEVVDPTTPDVPTEAPEPVPDHVVAEREADMKLLGDQAELIRMATRIAELEDQNKNLVSRIPMASQGQITTRKNPGEDIVQRTASGNLRTTFDPSPELRDEMATQEVKGS